MRLLFIGLLSALMARAQPEPESPKSWASRHYSEVLELVFPDPFAGEATVQRLWGLNGRITGFERESQTSEREIQVIVEKPYGRGGSVEAYYLSAGLQDQLREMRARSADLIVEAAAARIEKRHCGPITDEALLKAKLSRFSSLSFNVARGQKIRLDQAIYTVSVYGPTNSVHLDVGDTAAEGVSELTDWLSSILSILRQKCGDVPDIQFARH